MHTQNIPIEIINGTYRIHCVLFFSLKIRSSGLRMPRIHNQFSYLTVFIVDASAGFFLCFSLSLAPPHFLSPAVASSHHFSFFFGSITNWRLNCLHCEKKNVEKNIDWQKKEHKSRIKFVAKWVNWGPWKWIKFG